MTLDLDPIKAREAAATAGPWHPDGDECCVYADEDASSTGDAIAERILTAVDAAFIAAARADVPSLVAEVERLRERIEFLETVLAKDGWDGPMMFGKWPVTAGEATTALSEDE